MTSASPRHTEPLVEITRGELVESLHRGVIAVVDGNNKLLTHAGDVELRTYIRSAAKPFQAAAGISSGAFDQYQISPNELACITGSHSGEPIHLAAVQSILRRIGLEENALLCGAHMPFDEESARAIRSSGTRPSVLHNNCSGKHAGMLTLAVHLGVDPANYISPEHPVQKIIRDEVMRFTDVAEDNLTIAIDGCSAPVFGLSLIEMARGYARVVNSEHRIVSAMIQFPEMVGGNHNRLDTDLMRVSQGRLISKVGAEGIQLLGVLPCDTYPAGLGVAIKIEDGDSRRARDPVVIEVLRQLDLLNESQLEKLAQYTHVNIVNHRKLVVGKVRTCFLLKK